MTDKNRNGNSAMRAWSAPALLLAALLLMATFAACGGGDDPTPRPERSTTQPEATEPGATTAPASGQGTRPPTATTARPQDTEDAEPTRQGVLNRIGSQPTTEPATGQATSPPTESTARPVATVETEPEPQSTRQGVLNRIGSQPTTEPGDTEDAGDAAPRLMGILGGPGGGSSDALAYILEDADANSVEIINVASILGLSEIPAGLESNRLDTPGTGSFDDPEDWKDEWRDREWSYSLPVPSWLFSEVALDDLDTVIIQEVDGGTGYVLAGNFPFDDLRDAMEDEDWEEDTYRDFEVWDGRNVALLEDDGIILLGSGFASEVLKALDTGRGLIEDDGDMKRVLDKAGSGLIAFGTTEACGSFGSPNLRSCNAFGMSITGGTEETTSLRAAYLFSSEDRAESALDDVEEAILDTNEVDADIEDIDADGEFVTYEITIHEE